MKTVIILPSAAKALRRHRSDSELILGKIEAYAAEPGSMANNVRPLKGEGYGVGAKRLRVGDYRVILEETATEVIGTRVGPRGSVYD